MGNFRTHKPYYFEHGVIEFFSKNQTEYYTVSLWLKNGMSQFPVKTDKFEGITVEQIVAEIKSQIFSNVRVNER